MSVSSRTFWLGIISSGVLLAGCGSDSDNNPLVDIRLMETTDIHANVMDYNYYGDAADPKVGLVRTATLIKQARAALDFPDNSFLVDNGDLIQGSPMGDWRHAEGLPAGEIHPVYKAMNELGYDVANYGNHEFNYGLEFLAESVNDAGFPYISANVFVDDDDDNPDNDQLYFEPYRLVTKSVRDRDGNSHDITVGFIGFLPPQIMQWDKKNLEGEVITKDIKAMAERYVPRMKAEGADVIVAIPHSGISTTAYSEADKAENSSWYLADVEGIDAIMFGHSHLLFPSDSFADTPNVDVEKGTIKGVPAVMPGYWGSHLGVIDMTLSYDTGADQWSITNSQVQAQPIFADDAPAVEADSALVAKLAGDHQATIDYMNQPIGESTDDIYSFLAVVKDDPSIQIVADAQKAYVENLIEGDVNLQDLPVLSAARPSTSPHFAASTRASTSLSPALARPLSGTQRLSPSASLMRSSTPPRDRPTATPSRRRTRLSASPRPTTMCCCSASPSRSWGSRICSAAGWAVGSRRCKVRTRRSRASSSGSW